MKKYIKSSKYIQATYSPSMPDWFKKRIGNIRYRLESKYGYRPIKWDTIQFYDDDPNGTYTPVYLLDLGYDGQIYIPGVNDDASCRINGKGTHLGTLYNKPRKFKEFVVDTKYIDLNAPESRSDRERYYDPRYDRDSFNRMRYQGQQKYKSYYSDTYGWRQGYDRDKSGYRIPSPSEVFTRYYKKFPRAVLTKIDGVYQRILNLKDEISELKVHDDYVERIGTELRDFEDNSSGFNYSFIGYVFRKFDDIVSSYKSMLKDATNYNRAIESYEQDKDSLTEDQLRNNSYDFGYYGKRLDDYIKRIDRDISDLEKSIDDAKQSIDES